MSAPRDDRGYAAVLARERARQALEAYAERRMVDRDTGIIDELAGLVDRGRAAGLGEDTIAALAAGVHTKAHTPSTATGGDA